MVGVGRTEHGLLMVDIAEQSTEFSKWLAEISYAQKDDKYRKWLDQSEKIVRRYRDERKNSTAEFGKRRYNILWSNVQTLGPAIYGKMPKPIAERRFLDRDPAARLASLILERTLAFQMEIGGFHEATNKVVLDYLLPGMGVAWVRYLPEFEAQQIAQENDEVDSEESSEPAGEQDDEGEGSTYDKLTFERICFDYVYCRDFLWSPARCWAEVPWVAKRSWLDKSESTEQFGKEIADQMTFGDPKNKDNVGMTSNEPIQLGKSKKAEVWEIWCKPERCVYFIAPDTPGLMLKTAEDPLKLEGFWPCPEPLFATQTNDTLVPVPDYIEYQDQAAELDELTHRISMITTAIRANGVYNSTYPALARLLQDGYDNKLIPVDDWAAFAEKGGMPGALSLVPMDVIIKVLMELYNARDHVKQDLYEITGMSDILRGATDPNETASAQKIKANYATGRLGSRQEQVAEFCAKVVRIAGEIIAETFSPESLMQMSGIDQMNKEAVRNAVKDAPLPPKPGAQEPQGQPPLPPQVMQQQMAQWQQAVQQVQQQAAQAKQAELDQQFKQALEILRSDKLRGFRVDIETDSTIADDMQNDKAAAVELITGVMKMLEGAEQIGQSAPEMVKPLGGMLMWAYRKYRVGRTLEASLEDALDQIDARIEAQKGQPQPPSAEMITAQAQLQVAQAKAGEANASAQAETARSQADIQIAQAKLQGEQEAAKLQQQVETLTIQIDSMKAAAANNTDLKKAEMAFWQAILVAQIAAGQANNASEIDAKLQVLLGFGQMDHEKEMQANQQTADAQQAETDAANQPDGEGNTPAPKPRASPPSSLDAMRHKELMDNMSKNHEQVANAIGQVGVGLQQLAKAHSAPKRVVHDANGRPVGVETVN
jgi:hypothetical protein